MATLAIDLQDGFAGDTVEVTVDGEMVYRVDAVTTDYAIGLAARVEVEVPDGAVVGIRLPARGVEREVDSRDGRARFLAVSLDPRGGLTVRTSSEMFRYM